MMTSLDSGNSGHQLNFRQRLLAAHPMNGTFIKNTAPHSIEVLGEAGFDFMVLDAEHAPFDRQSLDLGLLACRAANVHGVVRVRDNSTLEITNALDLGAEGIIVPHISSSEDAERTIDAARHSGSRGFTNSSRAGSYGAKTLWEHVDYADEYVAIILMIEDPDAVARIHEILAVPGIDGVMVGRNDLRVAMRDRSPNGEAAEKATQQVIDACAAAKVPVVLFVASGTEAVTARERGVMSSIVASDQTLLRRAALDMLRELTSEGL